MTQVNLVKSLNKTIGHVPMGQNFRWLSLPNQILELVEQEVQASTTCENWSAVGSPFVAFAVHRLNVLWEFYGQPFYNNNGVCKTVKTRLI